MRPCDGSRTGQRLNSGVELSISVGSAKPLSSARLSPVWSRDSGSGAYKPSAGCGGPVGLSTARRVSVRAMQSTEGQKHGYCRRKQASTKRRDRESNDQPELPEQGSADNPPNDARKHKHKHGSWVQKESCTWSTL